MSASSMSPSNSVKEVMFSLAFVKLFVSRITQKNYSTDFHKIQGNVAHGPRKKPSGYINFDKGVGTNFGVGWERRGPKSRQRGWGFWGGAASPSPPARGLWELCKLPSGVRGGAPPGRRRVFLYSVPLDCLSQHLSTCCIQFAWLGIRFF